MESSHFFGHHLSMWHSTKRCSSIFDLGPLTPKIYSPKLLVIRYITTSPSVVALSAQQLRLGKVGNPLNFGADRCCHGNDIWAKCRDPVAYRLVIMIACKCSMPMKYGTLRPFTFTYLNGLDQTQHTWTPTASQTSRPSHCVQRRPVCRRHVSVRTHSFTYLTSVITHSIPELWVHHKLLVLLIASSDDWFVSVMCQSVLTQFMLEIIRTRHRKRHLTTLVSKLLRYLDNPAGIKRRWI